MLCHALLPLASYNVQIGGLQTRPVRYSLPLSAEDEVYLLWGASEGARLPNAQKDSASADDHFSHTSHLNCQTVQQLPRWFLFPPQ